MKAKVSFATVATTTARLLGWAGWGLIFAAAIFFAWCSVASSMSVNASIKSIEDPMERSRRLTAEAEAYFKGLEAERLWRVEQIERIKREQGLEK